MISRKQRKSVPFSRFCRRLNPYAEYMYDGINLSPFEVMFVKIKDYLLQANWTAAATVKKYTDWAHSKVGGREKKRRKIMSQE